jgi:predicted proteasome-type protease
MSAKEKANELVDRFGSGYPIICKMNSRNMYMSEAKQCALIAVDEILKSNPIIPLEYMLESEALDAAAEFWQQVKTEIENL